MNYKFQLEENPTPEDLQILQKGLGDFNREAGITRDLKPLAIFIRDNEKIVGGISAFTIWGWLDIKHLWISEKKRNQGFGLQLLKSAETEALKRGCHSAMVDTFSFQALKFYQKFGYEIYGKLDDFPVGHSRYFLKKFLKV